MKGLLNHKVKVSDGTALAVDVYLPDGPGPFPVILTRTPYHKKGMAEGVKVFLEKGYGYVTADTRGKFDSDGNFRPLIDEARDGHDTLDWIANQSWCNGRIGMRGMSYLGIVQIPAASGGHEALKCIVPGVAPNSFFVDWIRYDGCFAFANAVRWSLTHNSCHTQPSLAHFDWDTLYDNAKTLRDVFEITGIRSPALEEWVAHDAYDDYWKAVDQRRMYPRVKVPGMHIGGWFDHISRGQFDSFAGIKAQGQRLLVGPWGHTNVSNSGNEHRRYGEWDFGTEADFAVLEHELRFLELYLKDNDDGISGEPPVKAFLMGEDRWLDLDCWPPAGVRAEQWYLATNGRLDQAEPGDGAPDEYTYDPSDPVPTHGGAIYWGLGTRAPLGPADQRPILDRDDVLLYRSAPLEDIHAIVGQVELDLWISSSASDTDFIAKLCVEEPNGRITCLTNGSLRCRYRHGWSDPQPLETGVPSKVTVQMGHVAYVFPPRSRIALTVTSSCFPRILPHPNTMAPTWQESSPQAAKQQVFHSRECSSCLKLPVLDL